MLRIASNKSIDFLRSRRRQPRESLEALQETQDLDPPAPERDNPDHAYDHRDHNREIRRQLAQLPPEQRLVVELKFFQHCTFEDISYQTGVPVNTVKTRLYTALQKLRTRMEVQHVM
jgi:RNA polymerase sigma-70 factor (ECF subfamily)